MDEGQAKFQRSADSESADSKAQLGWLEGSAALVSTGVLGLFACSAEFSFIPSFRARMPSPIPLPSSGNFFGPKTNRAIKKITSKMHRLKQAFKHKTPPPPAAGSKPNTIESTHLRQLVRRSSSAGPKDNYLGDLPWLPTRLYVANYRSMKINPCN